MIQRYRYISFELLQTCCVVCDGSVRRFFVVPAKPVRRLIGTGSSPFGCCCVRMRQTQNGLDHRPHTRFASMTKSFISRNLSPTSHRKRRRTRSIFSFNPSYTLVSAASTILHQKKSQQQPVHHAS